MSGRRASRQKKTLAVCLGDVLNVECTQCTCFARTKVQILNQKALVARWIYDPRRLRTLKTDPLNLAAARLSVASRSGVSICTFVLVKQVNCTSKASKSDPFNLAAARLSVASHWDAGFTT